MTRCVNIDWLEVFAVEPQGIELDAEYFRAHGWKVEERGYGTRMYAEMFTLFSQGVPFIEIRRKPLSSRENGGIFETGACHIRLSNRTCYCDEPINVIRTFILELGYTFKGISRIDICMDFEKFDDGDDPRDFIQRYMRGSYSKINQTVAKARWEDTWSERFITWISWGKPSSMVSTKMYLKTRELKNVGDKPWIRQAWQAAGLIEDMNIVDKDIWRVEFSVKGSSAKWVPFDRKGYDMPGHEGEGRYDIMPNNLSMYESRYKLMHVFFELADRYFHFKKDVVTRDGRPQRKDRCPDKVLFRNRMGDIPYRLTRITTAVPETRKIIYLLKNLRSYASTVDNEKSRQAFEDAISWIDGKLRGIECSISASVVQKIFFEDFENCVNSKTDAPFIGDDFESFVYQYAFNKNFMNNS